MDEKKADIVITDDHKLFRKGIRALLEDFSFIRNIYEAANGEELISLLKSTNPPPEIVLLDIQMPVMDGIEAHKQIRKLFPHLKVLILTMEDDEQFMLHLIAEGVNGYLLKNSEPEELEAAIAKLLKTDFYFPFEMSPMLIKRVMERSFSKKGLPEFSSKELEILNYICREYTAPEIADKLNVSVRTVEGYRSRLLSKTSSKNIAGLVVYALKNKLVVL
ncbi:MAG: response regulator transcription factor [Mariniphaga sp.]